MEWRRLTMSSGWIWIVCENTASPASKNTWINIKSLFYAILTLIAVVASLVLLPLTIIFIAGFILFGFYKLIFTKSNN